jgi:hypothetical protein
MVHPGPRRAIVAALAALASIVLTGCEHGSAAEPAWQPRPGRSTAARADPGTVSATPVPQRPAGQFFGETHHYPDNLDLRVEKLTTAELGWFPQTSDDAAVAGDPYTLITVRLDNHSRARFRAVFTATAFYGPELTEAHTVSLEAATNVQTVEPGGTAVHELGFLLPDEHRDDVVLELAIDLSGHHKAYFVGSVRTA